MDNVRNAAKITKGNGVTKEGSLGQLRYLSKVRPGEFTTIKKRVIVYS